MKDRHFLSVARTVAILLACVLLGCATTSCASKPASANQLDPSLTEYDTKQALEALVGAVSPAPASEQIRAVYLINVENDLVLHQKNADTVLYPASTAKITAGLVACRALEGRLDERITLSGDMLAGAQGRQLHLAVGEELTVRDLLYAAICGGYNDAMLAVGYCAYGSVSAFVDAMNTEASRVGAVNTHYTNPTGLHDPAMVTTAADTARIAQAASTNELYMSICSASSYEIPTTNVSEGRHFFNRNALANKTNREYYNGYCRGMSAGYTDEGGWCLVTLWERDGASNLCVLMGGEDTDGAVPVYTYSRSLFNWCREQFAYRTIVSAEQAFDTVKVGLTGTSKSKADLIAASDLSLYLPRALDESHLSITYRLHDESVNAPISAGHEVGVVVVSTSLSSTSETVLGTVPLTVSESFDINPFLKGMGALRSYLQSRAFVAAVICFVVLLLIYLKWTSTPGGRYDVRSSKRRKRTRIRRR